MKITLKAPAKLNLALNVTGVLPNGYHTVDMVMQAVTLYDTVEVIKSHGYALRCPGSYLPANDKNNTVTKAAKAFFQTTGLLAGCEIVLHKKIPTRAGLGGGSADAAAVLVGLNKLYRARLTTAELCAIGEAVGADVPFAVLGGTARAEGIGEKLTPLPPLPPCAFLIAMPPRGVSTPQAYRRYDEMGTPVRPDINAATAAVKQGDLDALAPQMHNALAHANSNRTTHRLLAAFKKSGAKAAMMTGSGSAVFGLYATLAEAKRAKKQVARVKSGKLSLFAAEPVAHGPLVVDG